MTKLLATGLILWALLLAAAAAGFGHYIGGGCMELSWYCSDVR